MMRAKKLVAVLATVAFVCHETSARMNDPKEAEQLVSAETFSSSSATEASQPDETKSLRAAATATATEERAPKRIAEVALGGLAHGLGVAKKPRLMEVISDKNFEILAELTKSLSKEPSEAEASKIIADAYKRRVSAMQIYDFFIRHELLKHFQQQYIGNVARKTRLSLLREKVEDLFQRRHDANEVELKPRLKGRPANQERQLIRQTIEEWPEKYGEKLNSLDEILLKDADPQKFIQDVMSTTSPDFKERLEHFISQRIEQHNEIKTKVDELFADQVLPSNIFHEVTSSVGHDFSKGQKKYTKRYVDLRLKKRVDEELEKRVDEELEKRVDEELKKRVDEELEKSLNAGKDTKDVEAILNAPPFSLSERDVKHYSKKYREQQDMVSLTLNSF